MSNGSDGIVFVVSAPSGAGKTTLCNMAVDYFSGLKHSVSYTTRAPRPGETDGAEYHFVDEASFKEMEEAGDFLEHATVHGKSYGTSGKGLKEMTSRGTDVMVEIDVQGAAQLREKLSGGVYIFILPPTKEECAERLRKREKDAPDIIEERLKNAVQEIRQAPNYDYIVVNDDLARAFEDIKSVINAERVRKDRILNALKDEFDFD